MGPFECRIHGVPVGVCGCDPTRIKWTFTGVDGRTNLDLVSLISTQHPEVEFAILMGSDTGRLPIFPETRFVEMFRDRMGERGVPTAIHLCGRYSRMAVNPSLRVCKRLLSLLRGFGRVQINMRATDYEHHWERLLMIADNVPELVLQHRKAWGSVLPQFGRHPDVRFLFDRSGGRGVDSIREWPDPPSADVTGKRFGYAGGIGPNNIGRVLEFASRHPDSLLWFDMESRIRIDGWFSLGLVDRVLHVTSERV